MDTLKGESEGAGTGDICSKNQDLRHEKAEILRKNVKIGIAKTENMWYTNTVYIMPGKAFIKDPADRCEKQDQAGALQAIEEDIFFKGEDI